MRYFALLSVLFLASHVHADEPKNIDLAAKLKELADARLSLKQPDASNVLSRDVRDRLKLANRRDYDEWQKIKTKDDWEKFRDQRIAALKKSLGVFPAPANNLKVRVTGTIEGDGYRIENTLFESRPGLWVTANVYLPAKPGASMPGILIVHSHHNPKYEGELQDMGVMWARAGCCVLIMDQLGHGERRTHPFNDAKSYPEPFKVGRQDYFFRYNVGVQLSLIGESLIGWMAWDLMRGVDLLLAKPGIDRDKIILLGAVAAGGDAAAVTAALDPTIKCVVPFNFGGPQPETGPLGENAETTFDFAGSGSWESTRNLRNSARDGFLPWVIVASVAPRYLIHAHEFTWDREHDPVWKRYEAIWGFYNAKDRLAFTHGSGAVSGKPPEATHCNNIGPVQREKIHAAFEKWFGIKTTESRDRHSAEQLNCWTDEAKKVLKPKTVIELIGEIADAQFAAAMRQYDRMTGDEFADHLRQTWKSLLGVRPRLMNRGLVETSDSAKLPGCEISTVGFSGPDQGNHLLLVPSGRPNDRRYAVALLLCRQTPWLVEKERPALIAELLQKDIAVCIPDFRMPGAKALSSNLGRTGSSTGLSSSEEMLGETFLTIELQTVQSALQWLRASKNIDGQRIALLGDNLGPVNGPDHPVSVPHDAAKAPEVGDPFGGALAALSALYDPNIKAIAVRGGIFNLRSTLRSPFLYLPHDALIPDVVRAGDLDTVYGSLAPRPLRFEGMIDSLNRRLDAKALTDSLQPIQTIYNKNGRLPIEAYPELRSDADLASWVVKMIGK
jgi:dienelactone hydrolase